MQISNIFIIYSYKTCTNKKILHPNFRLKTFNHSFNNLYIICEVAQTCLDSKASLYLIELYVYL